MNFFQKRITRHTFVKYFLSYFVIFTVLILGFYYIIRSNLSNRYIDQLSAQSQLQLDNLAAELSEDLIFLQQIDSSLRSNINLINSRYSKGSWKDYQALQEIDKYDTSNKMINAICYTSKQTGDVLSSSTKYIVRYKEEQFRIQQGNSLITFDPEPYYEQKNQRLIYATDDINKLLIYFPEQNSTRKYILFFILDTTDILNRMNKIISDSMPAVALIDNEGRIVMGENSEELLPHLASLSLEDGIYEIDTSTALCIHTGISNDFSLVSLISLDSLHKQLGDAFAGSYTLLFLLSCAGFLLIFWAMRLTYQPLHRLTQKITAAAPSKQGYLEQLDDAFANALEQNHLLEEKLERYQLSVKKSLLDSVIESNYSDLHTALPNIDQLFDLGSPKEIFAAKMKSLHATLPCLRIQEIIQGALGDHNSCIILKNEGDNALFLIHFIGTEPNKEDILLELLEDLHRKNGYLFALSNGSESPMDIPALCENAQQASRHWSTTPVVQYSSLLAVDADFTYPHDKLEQLAEMLHNKNISGARSLLQNIYRLIDHSLQENIFLPDFYVRSILVDLVTLIISYMNQLKIDYKIYNDLYYETLYYCRSCPYTEKAEAIAANIQKLLDIYEQEAGTVITSAQIRKLIEESYCEPNFSIYELADKLSISFTYASNLIKKELNQNFSDYVWMLRLEKAKELLKQTNLSIDEISAAVGYINASSFRRKFKQETGLTPSEFRVKD